MNIGDWIKQKADLKKFKKNSAEKIDLGVSTWKSFYDVSEGDKFERALTATQKTYELYKKAKGKNE